MCWGFGWATVFVPCQAADTRHMAPVVYELAVRYDSGSDEHRLRRLCCKNIKDFYIVLDEAGMFLNDDEHGRVVKYVDECLSTYSALARISMEQGKLRWSMVTKHHFMWHLARQAQWANPKTWWCYGFEDFMGVCRHIAESCTDGTASLKVARRCFDKYLLALQYEVDRR